MTEELHDKLKFYVIKKKVPAVNKAGKPVQRPMNISDAVELAIMRLLAAGDNSKADQGAAAE